MRTRLVLCSSIVLVASAVVAACSSNEVPPGNTGGTGGTGATGGGAGTGGVAGRGAGGTAGTGGTTGGTAGAATGGTAGTATTGGAAGTGGSAGTAVGGTAGRGGGGGIGAGAGMGGASGSGGRMAQGGAGGAAGGPAGGAGGSAGAAAGSGGSGGMPPVMGPCDIYAAASPPVPCVAAYSTTRSLYSTYTGPLYQVRKAGNRLGTGGTLQDIGQVAGGKADSAAQDAFCGTDTCTFSTLYDQSGKANHLKVAPAGCYEGTASEPDYESDAKRKSVTLGGHKVYALYMAAHDGYRNNTPTDFPKGSASQGVYMVADGTHAGDACCWDFGNASTNNCNQGTMNALFFGKGYWGTGAGSAPWFMADLEGGVWAGGTGASTANNPNLPSSAGVPFAFGILKTSSSNYAIRVGNAESGALVTAYDGNLPKTLSHPGGIILGIGGDNSNSSFGTFFEGTVVAGRPTDATDAAVLANVQAAGYGK
jgi:non-reducing end alpha-L-arabinofuranosidase